MNITNQNFLFSVLEVARQECSLSSFLFWDTGSHYHTNNIIMSTINAASALLAILGNLAIIVTMKKKNLIKTPCDILLVSLALVDCVAALVAKPLFISLVMDLYHDHVTCDSLQHFSAAAACSILFCVACSFTHMVLIAGDRYFALRGPVPYRTHNAKKGMNHIKIFVFLWFKNINPNDNVNYNAHDNANDNENKNENGNENENENGNENNNDDDNDNDNDNANAIANDNDNDNDNDNANDNDNNNNNNNNSNNNKTFLRSVKIISL